MDITLKGNYYGNRDYKPLKIQQTCKIHSILCKNKSDAEELINFIYSFIKEKNLHCITDGFDKFYKKYSNEKFPIKQFCIITLINAYVNYVENIDVSFEIIFDKIKTGLVRVLFDVAFRLYSGEIKFHFFSSI